VNHFAERGEKPLELLVAEPEDLDVELARLDAEEPVADVAADEVRAPPSRATASATRRALRAF
jgi:hypothetical protein